MSDMSIYIKFLDTFQVIPISILSLKSATSKLKESSESLFALLHARISLWSGLGRLWNQDIFDEAACFNRRSACWYTLWNIFWLFSFREFGGVRRQSFDSIGQYLIFTCPPILDIERFLHVLVCICKTLVLLKIGVSWFQSTLLAPWPASHPGRFSSSGLHVTSCHQWIRCNGEQPGEAQVPR